MKFKRLNEAHYGGAFDIADDQYFTREDLDEFGYELADKVEKELNKPIDYVSSYIYDGFIEVTLSYDDYEVSLKRRLDMRAIRKPSDINKYHMYFVPRFEEEFKEIIPSLDESLNEEYDEVIDELMKKADADAQALIDRPEDKSPSDIMNDLGYFEFYDSDHKFGMGVKREGHNYSIVFDFSDYDDSLGELPVKYYVMKDGRIPSGYTITKMNILDEGIIKKIGEIGQAIKNRVADAKQAMKPATDAVKNTIKQAAGNMVQKTKDKVAELKSDKPLDNTTQYTLGVFDMKDNNKFAHTYDLETNSRETVTLADLVKQSKKYLHIEGQPYAIMDKKTGKVLLDTRQQGGQAAEAGAKRLSWREQQKAAKQFQAMDNDTLKQILVGKGMSQVEADKVIRGLKV